MGESVAVAVTLQEVKKRRFRFALVATNDHGVKIGEGIHRRALINVRQFAGHR
jgi:predicted thioesterase